MAVTFCELFLEFLRRNAMVSVVILAVMLVRLLLKKLPKKYAYALWGVVGLRMIFVLTSRRSLVSLIFLCMQGMTVYCRKVTG